MTDWKELQNRVRDAGRAWQIVNHMVMEAGEKSDGDDGDLGFLGGVSSCVSYNISAALELIAEKVKP